MHRNGCGQVAFMSESLSAVRCAPPHLSSLPSLGARAIELALMRPRRLPLSLSLSRGRGPVAGGALYTCARIASHRIVQRHRHSRRRRKPAKNHPFDRRPAGRHGRRGRRDRSRRLRGRRSVRSVVAVGVRRGAQRRHRHGGTGGGFPAVACAVARVRGVPVRAASRGRSRTGGGTGAAGVRPRVPRGLHREVAAAAPRVPALPPPRAAAAAAGRRRGACVGAAGDDDSLRLRRRESGLDA